MVSMTERIIHLERKSEDMAKKEHVERHDQDVRALQSTLTQVRTTMSSLESRAANWSASGGSDQGLCFFFTQALSQKFQV